MMTLEEFKESVYEGIDGYPIQWRLGQKIFNYIDKEYNIARKIQYRDNIDCFYNDDMSDKFIEKAYSHLHHDPGRVYQVQLGKTPDYANLVEIAEYHLGEGVEFFKALDHIWHLCNAFEWNDEYKANPDTFETISTDKDIEIKIKKGFTGIAASDLIIENPNNGWHYTKMIDWGWKLELDDAIDEILTHPQFYKVKMVQK